MKKRVLINVEEKDIRIAILEGDELCQLFVEQRDDKSIVGNIYKARVEGIVPGLQAAFVNIGLERNAFLHFSDILDNYILPSEGSPRVATRGAAAAKSNSDDGDDEADENGETAAPGRARGRGRSGPSRKNSPDAVNLKIGDEIVVQAIKEPISTKGARVSANISLPGRYLVLLPYSEENGGGISKRIESATERRRLRSLLKSLEADEGSWIIRTAGLSQDEAAIAADVQVLKKLWEQIQSDSEKTKAPRLVYNDHDILGRIVRDELSEDVDELIIDAEDQAEDLRHALNLMMPHLEKKVVVHDNLQENLFDRYDVENQYQKALRHRVWLKSGGYIIVDETEALIAIDVNSGKFVGKSDQESMILQTNLEAAEAVARQLRLRDMGGIIVVDFIDMRSRENQHKVERRFKDLLKKDRAKTSTCSLSELGLLEMTRKRVRQSLSKVVFSQCPYCQGTGRILTLRQVWKGIKYEILNEAKSHPKGKSMEVVVHPEMRAYIEDELLDGVRALATRCQSSLRFVENEEFHIEQYEVARQA